MDGTAEKPRALVVLDLDGTTLPRGATELTARVSAALMRSRAQGCAVAIATGRTDSIIPPSVRTLPFLDYLITSNGARVADCRSGACLFRGELAGETVLDMIATQRPLGAAFNLFLQGRILLEEGVVTYMLDEARDARRPQGEFKRSECREVVSNLGCLITPETSGIEKLGCTYPAESALRAALPALEQRGDIEAVWVQGREIEVTAAGVHKGAALARLMALLDLPRERILAFGDSNNDLSMASVARLVAMGNAVPSVKAAAHAVTASVEEDGVALYLERWLEGF
jgi:Cof subfamily protein (haloacid dehalogenase superfamily)